MQVGKLVGRSPLTLKSVVGRCIMIPTSRRAAGPAGLRQACHCWLTDLDIVPAPGGSQAMSGYARNQALHLAPALGGMYSHPKAA